MVRVSSIVNDSISFDSFFKSLIGYMWELTGEGARVAQHLVSEVLATEVMSAIDSLERRVSDVKGDAAMVDLMQEIKNARSNFLKEIEVVLNWFRFVGSGDGHSLERLGVVIEAAASSFTSVFRHRGKSLVYSQTKSSLLLNYSEARALFISMFTALENALRYGIEDMAVNILHRVSLSRDELIISNEVKSDFGDPAVFLAREKAKWIDENSGLSTAEGGSGLYKINNILTNASPGFSFNISVEHGIFNAQIGLDHGYFGYRGQPSKTKEDF